MAGFGISGDEILASTKVDLLQSSPVLLIFLDLPDDLF